MKAHIIIYLLSHNSDSFSLKKEYLDTYPMLFFNTQSQNTFVFSPGQKKMYQNLGARLRAKSSENRLNMETTARTFTHKKLLQR
jgi:hypothetical protein